MKKRKECPVCTNTLYPESNWVMTTPLKEKFTFCSVDCLIHGADNLSELDDAKEEKNRYG